MSNELIKINSAEEEEAKRVADKSHREKIEANIVVGLMGCGIIDAGGGAEKAMKIVDAIKSGKIPYLTINY